MSLMLDRFTSEDLPGFLALAAAEGWLCDLWEFAFLLRKPEAGCFVLRTDRQVAAYITAIAYGAAGWIGNLIVAPEYRQQGLGRRLMLTAIAFLEEAGADCIWLTASAQGAPLYTHLGFRQIDRIERWVGNCIGAIAGHPAALDFDSVSIWDAAGWGEPRTSLLREKASLGDVWQGVGAFMIRHVTDSGTQIGPWGGVPEAAAKLFSLVLAGKAGQRVFLDVPAANKVATALFAAHGMTCRGETVLMCRGDTDGYSPAHIFALGTMGSVG